MINELNKAVYNGKIVTILQKYYTFYPAENYLQNYFELNPENQYRKTTLKPKIRKFIQKMQPYLTQSVVTEENHNKIQQTVFS